MLLILLLFEVRTLCFREEKLFFVSDVFINLSIKLVASKHEKLMIVLPINGALPLMVSNIHSTL